MGEQWGRYLEIEGARLRAIRQQCLNDPQQCLMAVLEVWLAYPTPHPPGRLLPRLHNF